MHDVRGSGSSRAAALTVATTGPAATRRRRRQTIRGASGGCGRRKSRVEIRSKLHVLMEKRGAACQLLGTVVSEDRPDDRALRKCRCLREYTLRKCSGCRAHSQHLEHLPAGQTLRKKL